MWIYHSARCSAALRSLYKHNAQKLDLASGPYVSDAEASLLRGNPTSILAAQTGYAL